MASSREDNLTFQEKIQRHRLEIIYRSVLGVFLVAAVIIIIRIRYDNLVYSDYEVLKKAESVGSAESVVLPYGDSIVSYSRDGIAAYNGEGEKLWNETYEMQSPVVDVNGDYVVVCDYRGNTIYVMNSSGSCGKIEINKVILDVKVSSGGMVIATLDDDEVCWINVYDASGNEMVNIRTSMDQTGFPLALSMSSDNKKMGVSYLKTSGNLIEDSIAFYNFGDVGQNVQDKIVSGYDYESTVIPFIRYLNPNEAVAMDDKMLRVYRGSQIPELAAETELPEGIKSVHYGDNLVAVVSRNAEGEETYRISVYNMSGSMIFERTFSMEYKDVVLKNGSVLIYNETDLLMFNKKGLEKFNGSIGTGVKAVIPAGRNTRLLIAREDHLESVKLK